MWGLNTSVVRYLTFTPFPESAIEGKWISQTLFVNYHSLSDNVLHCCTHLSTTLAPGASHSSVSWVSSPRPSSPERPQIIRLSVRGSFLVVLFRFLRHSSHVVKVVKSLRTGEPSALCYHTVRRPMLSGLRHRLIHSHTLLLVVCPCLPPPVGWDLIWIRYPEVPCLTENHEFGG